MITVQRLILIMASFQLVATAHAATSEECAAARNELARTAQQLLALTAIPLQASPSPTYVSSSRVPAQQVDDIDDNGSAEGTQQGMGAIFNWFDRNTGRSRGICTKAVRMALQAGGWWPCGQGLGLSPQTDAGPNLRAHGFKKIQLSDPSKAKPGTILIYKSVCSSRVDKNARYGHIEMRTNRGYASDFFKTVPISSYNRCRKFKEAYVKVGPPGRSCNQRLR